MESNNTTLIKPQITIIDTQSLLIKDRSTLKLIEAFMNYPDGYLSHKLTWNDIMPVVERVESIGYKVEILLQGCDIKPKIVLQKRLGIILISEAYEFTKIHSVLLAIISFINWYNLNNQISHKINIRIAQTND